MAIPTGAALSGMAIAAFLLSQNRNQIGVNHLSHKRIESGLVPPPELEKCFARVASQVIDLGRSEIARIDFDQHPASGFFNAFFVHPRSRPNNRTANMGEGFFY